MSAMLLIVNCLIIFVFIIFKVQYLQMVKALHICVNIYVNYYI